MNYRINEINLYIYCWFGLGTPFIWLSTNHENYRIIWLYSPYIIMVYFLYNSIFLLIRNYSKYINFFQLNKIQFIFFGYMYASLAWSPISGLEKLINAAALATVYLFTVSSIILIIDLSKWRIFSQSISYYIVINMIFYLLKINSIESYLLLILYYIYYSINFDRKSHLHSLITFIIVLIICIYIDIIVIDKVYFYNIYDGLFINMNLNNRLIQAGVVSFIVYTYLNKSLSIYTSLSALCAVIILVLMPTSSGHLMLIESIFIIYFVYIINKKFISIKYREFLLLSYIFTIVALLILFLAFTLNFSGISTLAPSLYGVLHNNPDSAYRLHVWAVSISQLDLTKSIFGVGFDGFWGGGDRIVNNITGVRSMTHLDHAHNGFIDLYLQFGVIGVLLLAASLFDKIRYSCAKKEDLILTVIVVSFLITSNLFESNLIPNSSANFVTFTMLSWILFKNKDTTI